LNSHYSDRLLEEPDLGGVMTTAPSVLDRITARIKEIVRIAEGAASQAMKAESAPPAKRRAGDMMRS
jgi:hypothetical protein